jgi:hypothetical protein
MPLRPSTASAYRSDALTLFKASLDYYPSTRYGASITLVRAGDLDDEPLGGGSGRLGYGNYTVVDLGGRFFLDADRRHRLDLHINNVLNHVYCTALGSGVTDASGDRYFVHDLALPLQ